MTDLCRMMLQRFLGLIILVCILLSETNAQFQNIRLFDKDSGQFLLTKLFTQFKPQVVLDYTQARIKMYKEIYNENDTVKCVYTKHALYLDPQSADPIGYLIKNNNSNGINCEHTYPQSKGAETGNARSDMHHLFPARAAANEARLNYPFGEINDNQTDEWYYKSFTMSSKPTTLIDEYSESINGSFEPREDHKGNAARAVFYFFTMYDVQADRAFFESMRQTLCQWHIKDPVDSLEWTRSQMIAKYQDNKANPFVLDCSLARRCFCPSLPSCEITNSLDLSQVSNSLKLQPLPANEHITLSFDKYSAGVQLELLDFSGRVINTYQGLRFPISLDVSPFPSGHYILKIQFTNGQSIFKKLILD